MKTRTPLATRWLGIGLGLAWGSAARAQAQTTITWTGAMDNIYTRPGNWNLGRVPNRTDNAVIPATPVQLILDATLGIGVAGNLTIQAGASLTMNSLSELDLFGNLTNNGSFGGAGTLSVRSVNNALTTHTLGGTGSAISLQELETFTNAPTTLNIPVRVSRLLTLTADLSTSTAGTLTLLSTPGSTGTTAFVVNSGGW